MSFRAKMFLPPEEKPSNNKKDTVEIFSDALTYLYQAKNATRGIVANAANTISHNVFGTDLPKAPIEQTDAEEKALAELQQLSTKFYKGMAQSLLEAHQLLGTGCVKNNEADIRKALNLLKNTLTLAQIKAFLEVRILGDQTDIDFKILGFLGYASEHKKIDIVSLLLNGGGNPNSKPLLEKKGGNTYHDKPIFFSVATHTKAWIDYRNPMYIKTEFVSIDTSVKLIKHYLNAGFDINTIYQKQNVLQHAYTDNLSTDMHYNAHVIAHTIAIIFESQNHLQEKDQTITATQFTTFCDTLKKAELLKSFPVLAIQYATLHLNSSIYQDDNELHYYLLKSFLFNLIGLCAYEKFRIENDFLSTVSSVASSVTKIIPDAITKIIPESKEDSSSKLDKLNELLPQLKKLQETNCAANYETDNEKLIKYSELIQHLKTIKSQIGDALDMQRAGIGFLKSFGLFESKTTGAEEWEKFLKMNTLETNALTYRFTMIEPVNNPSTTRRVKN